MSLKSGACCRWTAHSVSQQKLAPSYKWGFEGQTCSNGECWVKAAEDGAEQHELSDAHVDRQAGQVVAQRGQLLICGQSSQVLKALLGSVQASHWRGLDEPREDWLQRLLREHIQDLDSVTERSVLWTTVLEFLQIKFHLHFIVRVMWEKQTALPETELL